MPNDNYRVDISGLTRRYWFSSYLWLVIFSLFLVIAGYFFFTEPAIIAATQNTNNTIRYWFNVTIIAILYSAALSFRMHWFVTRVSIGLEKVFPGLKVGSGIAFSILTVVNVNLLLTISLLWKSNVGNFSLNNPYFWASLALNLIFVATSFIGLTAQLFEQFKYDKNAKNSFRLSKEPETHKP